MDKHKLTIKFAIRSIVREQMLLRRMGTWNDVLGTYEFSNEEMEQTNEIIRSMMFPCGYYKLCDLIGEKYV